MGCPHFKKDNQMGHTKKLFIKTREYNLIKVWFIFADVLLVDINDSTSGIIESCAKSTLFKDF
jgi:hypothetical protein